MSMKRLAHFSRQMATMLEAGVPMRVALDTLARTKDPLQRKICLRLAADLDRGSTFHEALERQGRRFPLLYRRAIRVGETSGDLETALHRLADYYEFLRALIIRLLGKAVYPFAIFALALAVFPLLRILAGLGVVALLIGALMRSDKAPAALFRVIMRIPVFGPALQMVAVSRFSLAMELMTAAAVNISDSVRWSAEATCNAFFSEKGRDMAERLQQGARLSEAMAGSGIFPLEVLMLIQTSETVGGYSEQFRRISRIYLEKAEQRVAAAFETTLYTIWIVSVIAMGIVVILGFMRYLGHG